MGRRNSLTRRQFIVGLAASLGVSVYDIQKAEANLVGAAASGSPQSGSTLIFSDDMSGTFSDNWTDVSYGTASATFASGELKLNRSTTSSSTGAHAACKTGIPLSGVVDIYGDYKPIADAGWYQTAQGNSMLRIGVYPADYHQNTSSWNYYQPEKWNYASGYHDAVWLRFRNNNDDFYVSTYSESTGQTTAAQTYVDAGGSWRSFQFQIDWEAETCKGFVEGNETASLALASGFKSACETAGSTGVMILTFYNYVAASQDCYFDNIEVYQS
jgi:hypothetical protein